MTSFRLVIPIVLSVVCGRSTKQAGTCVNGHPIRRSLLRASWVVWRLGFVVETRTRHRPMHVSTPTDIASHRGPARAPLLRFSAGSSRADFDCERSTATRFRAATIRARFPESRIETTAVDPGFKVLASRPAALRLKFQSSDPPALQAKWSTFHAQPVHHRSNTTMFQCFSNSFPAILNQLGCIRCINTFLHHFIKT